MEIHKPKPFHNWREFLKEYAIIVIGVLTALAAEQAVESWHWQHRVHDAMEAMQLELRDDDAPQAYTRAAAMRCFDNQLSAIQAAIEAGRSRADITALVDGFTLPSRSWDSNAWDAMLSSGVAAHVAPDKMIKLGQVYAAMPIARAVTAQEDADKVALRPTRQSGAGLSTSEADTMLAAIARLRAHNRRFGEGSNYLLAIIAQNGVVLAPEQKTRILADLHTRYGDCVVKPAGITIDPNAQLDTTHAAGK